MLSKIKGYVFHALSRIKTIYLRARGVTVGNNVVITGLPYIRLHPGSSIILHDGVTVHSSERHSALVTSKAKFTTLSSVATIELGAQCGISGCFIVCSNRITIGEHTIIGPNTLILDSYGHTYSKKTGWKGCSSGANSPIQIGKMCYIGYGCIIQSGVTIGDNVVVNAGTVVSTDIPAGHIATGNPMQVSPLPKALGGIDNRANRTNSGC